MASLSPCRACGTPVAWGAPRCPNCDQFRPSPSRNRLFKWAYIVIGVLLGLVLLARNFL